jgi:hypothetical protein
MSPEMRRVVWRLEFPQPPGWRIQWLGPYTSQWLTDEAEEIVRYMEAEHCATHPHPSDPPSLRRTRAMIGSRAVARPACC